jgi:SAM-dependent methyltransferase
MNRTDLKNYAPQARRDFIQAITYRAAHYGLTANKIEPVVERGDVAVIAGKEHPRAVARKRKQLEERIKRQGFEQTMEALAYTWFNRLVAIRFMELHDYLDHGYRVLSHPEGKVTPEILEHAEHVDLVGLKKSKVIDLKLAGNKEGELYRLLLTAQCNALNAAMPFLFEKIDDETELLLPDNLLHSDSLIRKLVGEIEEEDWKEVEVIGWLYQFYISERKAEVIGKVVASEDIPAATQLFTPNWIVKYLVQNSLGRQWLATYPQSALRQQMRYYIEPAEQTPAVQEQLKAITPTSLNPEELTLLDPACGSGHMLTEAYDLVKAIYQERGYRAKDIPALILQKNLFGLEIDDRAAQLAAFALMMKARADDHRIFDSEAKPNVLSFQESKGFDAAAVANALNAPINKDDAPPDYLFEEIEEAETPLLTRTALGEKGHVSQGDIGLLLALFEHAKTFGSLIRIPPKLAARFLGIEQRFDDVIKHGDLMHTSAHVIKPLLQQAKLLARQYDAVVANPPYMGGKAMNPWLKRFAQDHFPDSKADTFAMFIERGLELVIQDGFSAMVTMQSWMFLSSYEKLRDNLLTQTSIECMSHMANGVMSIAFGTAATVWRNKHLENSIGSFCWVEYEDITDDGKPTSWPPKNWRNAKAVGNSGGCFHASTSSFKTIPGSPIAYWASERIRNIFATSRPLCEVATPAQGMTTSDNNRFLRLWHEIEYPRIEFGMSFQQDMKSKLKWFPYNKGGNFRKWYGNSEFVVNYGNDGEEMKLFHEELNKTSPGGRIKNQAYYFLPCISWSKITSGGVSFRFFPKGFIFDVAGSAVFATSEVHLYALCGLLNSKIAHSILTAVSPTMNYEAEHISMVPVHKKLATGSPLTKAIADLVTPIIETARYDWDCFETSWDFQLLPALKHKVWAVQQSQDAADAECLSRFSKMKELEEENNRLLIEAYGLQDELSPEVPDDQITLHRPDRGEDIKRLLSYTIGCMMGRYSLDKPGLIYARSDNKGFDPSQYESFLADNDGVIPLLDTDWGIRDDAANRVVEFVGVAWPKEYLQENLKFVADSLGPTNGEQPKDTIRHYLAAGFYKHHLSIYKKRPIYWLFSSGKQRAFQCLVYLHRYHEGTLARMRTEYVIPLLGQIAARIEQLEGDKAKATSTSHRNKIQKEQDNLKKQQAELLIFEEKLKHAADQKISLHLDDGVKVNYGKFGDLLAEAKAITGGKDGE